jgi:hypothetical protein
VTALLGIYREPDDCPQVWYSDGERPCTRYFSALPHSCIIQSGHNHPCICVCGSVPRSRV